MSQAKDITNSKSGKLTAIKHLYSTSEGRIWLCKCECGNTIEVPAKRITQCKTTSCGCGKYAKHGGRKNRERLYSIWSSMISRCYNERTKSYENYGGRGIKVCEEWKEYQSFKSWSFQNGYDENLTLERLNVNEGYSPNNCTWITKKEQMNNTRRNRLIEINGIVKNATQWSNEYSLDRETFMSRYNRGVRGKDLLKPPKW